uniref:Uncharacterized protein n=1 Tax=Leersia perrieri TaxID=77586 RepID=A0A0D9W4F1_9ORYZ
MNRTFLVTFFPLFCPILLNSEFPCSNTVLLVLFNLKQKYNHVVATLVAVLPTHFSS